MMMKSQQEAEQLLIFAQTAGCSEPEAARPSVYVARRAVALPPLPARPVQGQVEASRQSGQNGLREEKRREESSY